MAVITEEPEEQTEPKPLKKMKQKPQKPQNAPSSSSSSSSSKAATSNDSSTANAFIFWAYFTLAVSLVTFIFVFLSSLRTPQDDKSWFLSLPTELRLHYSKGKTVKVQTNPNASPIELFAVEDGPKNAETVLLLHGLGSSSYSFRQVVRSLGSNGIRAVAVDLPGSGFSDKSRLEEDVERSGGVLGRVYEVYSDIKEKGLFWGFDQLVETGRIPYEDIEISLSRRKSLKLLKLGAEEMGHVIGQVIDSLGLAPVHLVLHDSALGMSANWVTENWRSVSSLTLIDSAPSSVALPLGLLEMPVVREVLLGFSSVYGGYLRLCCSKSIGVLVAEAHRVLLKGRDGRRAVVGVGRNLNYSFDVAEWAGLEVVKGVPIQVLWSGNWSQEWSKEGKRVANAIPQARFILHSGGRWPQEDAADEIAEIITAFISSLPKSIRQVEEEPLPEHIQKMFDEAKASGHHHHHHHHDGHDHHGSHGNVHSPNYMDAYGLNHGWAS